MQLRSCSYNQVLHWKPKVWNVPLELCLGNFGELQAQRLYKSESHTELHWTVLHRARSDSVPTSAAEQRHAKWVLTVLGGCHFFFFFHYHQRTKLSNKCGRKKSERIVCSTMSINHDWAVSAPSQYWETRKWGRWLGRDTRNTPVAGRIFYV